MAVSPASCGSRHQPPVASTHRSRYADRFDPAAWPDDEPVGVFVAPNDPDTVWVSEWVFLRLLMTAGGYGLHLLRCLAGTIQ